MHRKPPPRLRPGRPPGVRPHLQTAHRVRSEARPWRSPVAARLLRTHSAERWTCRPEGEVHPREPGQGRPGCDR